MARQTPEQARESRRLGGINSAAGRPRYPKGHPNAGQLMPKGATASALPPPGAPPPPEAPPPPAPRSAEPPPSGRGRMNPLTATPRDLVDRILGR